ncbi:MAG: hypothetical protein GAK38_03101 [Xylophilus sp.]|nr:MAG: hypothetical protein GAK38_03101 [Xylophilus sp.]
MGLSDPRLGTLQLGSVWGPFLWPTSKSDAFGRAQLGALQTMTQGAPNRGYTLLLNNAVHYATPQFGGLLGRLYIQSGEGASTPDGPRTVC